MRSHSKSSHGNANRMHTGVRTGIRKTIRKAVCLMLSFVLLISVFTSSFVGSTPVRLAQARTGASRQDQAPTLREAQAALLTDKDGNVLWAKDPDTQFSLASVTKVMSAMVLLDSKKELDQQYSLTDVDLGPHSQTAGYKAGQTATLQELLEVMLVFSANDAAVQIARIVSGNEQAFVDKMNKKAASLGMKNTHFTNPHGLEDAGKHYSTVRDMVRMGREALEKYPLIAKIVKMHEVKATIDGKERYFKSTDHLMKRYKGLLGIKTGSVESGTTFLGAAERNGVRLYCAVLGCKTNGGRFDDSESLLNWGFSNILNKTIIEHGTVVRWAPFAFNFLFRCPVISSQASGVVHPSKKLDYHSLLYTPNTLVKPGDIYGVTLWSQEKRPVATCTYRVGALQPVSISYDELYEVFA